MGKECNSNEIFLLHSRKGSYEDLGFQDDVVSIFNERKNAEKKKRELKLDNEDVAYWVEKRLIEDHEMELMYEKIEKEKQVESDKIKELVISMLKDRSYNYETMRKVRSLLLI